MSSDLLKTIIIKLQESNCAKVARETGLSVQTVNRIKNSKVKPHQKTLNALCVYFLVN